MYGVISTPPTSGHRDRHRGSSRPGMAAKTGPPNRRMIHTPAYLRLDSAGEVTGPDAPGHQRANKCHRPGQSQKNHTANAVFDSIVPPFKSHSPHTPQHLMANRAPQSVAQGINVLEELLSVPSEYTVKENMASYVIPPFAKQASPSKLGQAPPNVSSQWETMNYFSLPQGVFPCHVFQAMQSHSFAQPQVPSSGQFYQHHTSTTPCSLMDRVMRTFSEGVPLAFPPQQFHRPANSMPANKTSPEPHNTSKNTASPTQGNSPFRPTSSESLNGSVNMPERKESKDNKDHAVHSVMKSQAVNPSSQNELHDEHKLDTKQGTDQYATGKNTEKNHAEKCSKVETTAGEKQNSESCQEVCDQSPSVLSVNIPSSSSSTTTSSPVAVSVVETASSKTPVVRLSSVSSSTPVKRMNGVSVVAVALNFPPTIENAGSPIQPESDDEEELLGAACVASILRECAGKLWAPGSEHESPTDDSFWDDSGEEEVDAESQMDVLDFFQNQLEEASILLGPCVRRLAEEVKSKEEQKAKERMRRAVKEANSSWNESYSAAQTERRDSKVHFTCGSDVDRVHEYERDPTTVQEYLQLQAADAARRRRESTHRSNSEEEDVPVTPSRLQNIDSIPSKCHISASTHSEKETSFDDFHETVSHMSKEEGCSELRRCESVTVPLDDLCADTDDVIEDSSDDEDENVEEDGKDDDDELEIVFE